jgi:hypothetical protein
VASKQARRSRDRLTSHSARPVTADFDPEMSIDGAILVAVQTGMIGLPTLVIVPTDGMHPVPDDRSRAN